jgi:hypothetical protein
MLRTGKSEAVALLQESLSSLPGNEDARSEFFVQWRMRSIGAIERIFPYDAEALRQFKEIEFSPRRLTKDDTRDAQLRLDAYLSGCVAARETLERLLRRVEEEYDGPPPGVRVVTFENTPDELIYDPASPAAEEQENPIEQASTDAEPMRVAPAPPPAEGVAARVHEPPQVLEVHVQELVKEVVSPAPARKGAMKNKELLEAVRGTLSGMLGAWDHGDRDAASMVSAKLLADLMVLARDEEFKAVFDSIVGKMSAHMNAAVPMETLRAAAPLCVWSLVLAMSEVMRG